MKTRVKTHKKFHSICLWALLVAMLLCMPGTALCLHYPGDLASGEVFPLTERCRPGTPNVTTSFNSTTGLYQIHVH